MRRLALLLCLAALAPGSILGQDASLAERMVLEPFELPEVDLLAAQLADKKRQNAGEVAHYAVPIEVGIEPWDGGWEPVSDEEVRWTLRLRSSGALSLNLFFDRYRMAEGGRLEIYAADGGERIGPFTTRDNEDHEQLWTPPLLTDDLIVELTLPTDLFALDRKEELDQFQLRLARVHHGYAGFGEDEPLSGSCQRDVACAASPLWHDAARSVALVSIDGVRFCSGFMVNNTALDGKPLFVTARHCGVDAANAPSVVVMWNYESPACRAGDDPELVEPPRPSQSFQNGAQLRAVYEPTDIVLLELDDLPNPVWDVHYAGWDRSDDIPFRTVVIHHPNTDAKRFGIDQDRGRATFYLRAKDAAAGDHLRVGDWELGTTEGGSSGSPLFDQNQRVIGQLHGGYAGCGNREADWFGRFAVSWQGNGQRGGRLSDWLDPLDTGTLTLDGDDADDLRPVLADVQP